MGQYSSSAVLRREIEAKLSSRIPAALSPQAVQAPRLAFAGLWDAWKEPDGKWLQSFSMITTESNEIMAPIHTCMPVILHPRNWEEWLDRDDSRPALAHLLRPYDSDEMLTDCCNPAVGNVRNNGPEMLNSV